MKKAIKIITLIILVLSIIYFGFIRRGFSILTGLGTPYSYFEAKKATKNNVLFFYRQTLPYYLPPYINYDSLELLYGFGWRYGGTEVSYPVIKLYNSVIEKELHHRLGKRWDEYQSKVDSISKKKGNEMDIKLSPGQSESPKRKKER